MKDRKIFVVLGADNTGKTTMINESMRFAQTYLNKTTSYKHFSAPKLGEDALAMYRRCLAEINSEMPQYVYLDRAWPESKFYEKSRRNIDLDIERCLEVEQEYVDFAAKYGYDLSINLMHKPWDYVEKFHRQELEHNQEFVQHSAIVNNEPTEMDDRHLEFNKYYTFMMNYMRDREGVRPDMVKNFPWNILQVRDLNFVLV